MNETVMKIIPAELRALPHWVTWKLEQTADGKLTKIPYSKPGVKASSTDRTTWNEFEPVSVAPVSNESGIGFVFDGDSGIVGIDIDHCIVNGEVEDKYTPLLNGLPSYTEISPSGTGVHIYVQSVGGEPYETGRRKDSVEVYSRGRYFTVTGNHYKDTPLTVNKFSATQIRFVLDQFLGAPTPTYVAPPRATTNLTNQLSTEDIIRIATNAANGQKFVALMRGNTGDYGGDNSRADMALASMLAFYTQDPFQIEQIMRSSGLARKKWDEHKTYLREMTIGKALMTCTEHFESKTKTLAEEGKAIFETLSENMERGIPAMLEPIQETTEEFEAKCKAILDAAKLPEFVEIPDGIFHDYIEFGKKVSYSKPEFHFASLLAIASMAIGRKAVIRIGMQKVYCNVNVMVVGHTTISGKSAACNMAMDNVAAPVFVERQNAIATTWDWTQQMTGTMSEAAFVQQLHEVWNNLWYFDDCGGFFDDAQSWNSHILGTLCSVYDGSKVERTLSKSGKKEQTKWSCPEPYVSLLWNTTINNLEEAASAKLFTSGFFPRIMWFIGEGGEPRKNAPHTEEDQEIVGDIRYRVQKMVHTFNDLKNDSVAFNVNNNIEEWNLANNMKYLAPEDEQRRAACGRGFVHIYKIAAILTLADEEIQNQITNAKVKGELPLNLDIPEKYSNLAIKIMDDYLLPRMLKVANMSLASDLKNHQIIMRKGLEKYGGVCPRTKLMQYTHLKRKEFNDAVETMLESEEIVEEIRKTDGAAKATAYYILKR